MSPEPRAESRARPHSPSRRDFEEGRLPVWAGPLGRHGPRPCKTTAVHTYAVVLLVTRGESRVHHAGEVVRRPGDVHLIPPGDVHGRETSDGEGLGIAFYPDALPAKEGESPLGPLLKVRQGCHPVLRPTVTQRRRLRRWILLVADELSRNEPGRDEACLALLKLVLLELERMTATSAPPDGASVSLGRKALTYIEAHCLEPLSLAKVARALGRSAPHVASIVRQETGRTVGEWILECRMAEARRRLRGTDERVDIIAERVGYADVTHFIRLFRRVHGITPAAWRRHGGNEAR
ncbi:AraC family transcriptional regulator [Myxococcus sp. K15C18031901]|uniref:helix-turn-helix domain-containing protein n=1 Tax=Myxococcus dinghuensis TaxID=2906761 RepID=UPI0020A7BB99|nr:AraC family transcriptional regulator [Myxococcus dinghuensis]MCP3104116.1 AraC family transcriptional regulator [Myxococcus dinghuensis]